MYFFSFCDIFFLFQRYSSFPIMQIALADALFKKGKLKQMATFPDQSERPRNQSRLSPPTMSLSILVIAF